MWRSPGVALATLSTVVGVATGMFTLRDEVFPAESGTAGALDVNAYRADVGEICDEVNLAENARRRDDRRLGSALRAARSTLAQRDALLDAARKSAARSSHAFSGFAALSAPRADAATDRSTTEAWKRNLARLRAYIERLDRTTDYADLLAAVDRLSRDRSGLARDGLVVNTGLKHLGANRCVIDPPVVTRTITLPAEPRAARRVATRHNRPKAKTARRPGNPSPSAVAPATAIPNAPDTGAGAGRSVTPRVNTPQQPAPKPRVNTPSSDGPVSGGGEDG
jgi:hypothetical protein